MYIALDNLAYEGGKKTKLQDKKLGIEAMLTDIELQIIKLRSLEADEQGKYDTLKAYTDTRPQEITVIGFVEKPKPCEGLAFKNSEGKWMLVTPDGKERSLTTPPALAGDFNWGVQNEDGHYDCACVWSGTAIRTGGFTYNLGIGLRAAGVIKDTADKGLTTIKAVAAYSNTIITAVVKDGAVINQTSANITGAVIPASTMQVGSATGSACLVDKSGEFAICAAYPSEIFKVDLMANTSEQINLPRLSNGDVSNYVYDSLSYGVDGDIMMIARMEYFQADIPYTARETGYIVLEKYMAVYFNKNGMFTRETLYEDSGHSVLLGISPGVRELGTLDSAMIGAGGITNRFICTIVDDSQLHVLRIEADGEPGNFTTNGGLAYSGESFISSYSYTLVGSEVLQLAYGARPLNGNNNSVHHLTSLPRSSGDFSGATVRGFSAGCAKIKGNYADKMWIEYRGSGYTIVNQPSTDYTILI